MCEAATYPDSQPVHGAPHAPRDVRSGPREISDLSFFEIFELPSTTGEALRLNPSTFYSD
jgi:hypothetical protein